MIQGYLPGFLRPMSEAPMDAVTILAETWDGQQIEIHHACDLSGEEQPLFRGWFEWVPYENAQPWMKSQGYMREVDPKTLAGWTDVIKA
jgi:hypothetical protein